MKPNDDQRMMTGTPVIVRANGFWFYGRRDGDHIQMDIENFATGAEALAWCKKHNIAAEFKVEHGDWLTMVQIDHLQTIEKGERLKNRQELRGLERGRMIARGKPIKRRISWHLLFNGIQALKMLQLSCKV